MKIFSVSIVLICLAITGIAFANNISTTDSVKYEFAPLVVTGQRYVVPQKDVAASITIIEPSEIRNSNITTAADVVSYLTPGVFTTRRSNVGYGVAAMAGGSISIRGMGGKPNSQILMLIDGRPDFQGIFSHPLNDAYLMDNVDHIEVIRGPASAVYGTNALGGVVNIITKKLPVSGFNTNMSINYGSFNTQRYLMQHSGALGNFQYFTSISHNYSDGHRDNSRFEGQNYALKLGYHINHHLKLSFNGNITPYHFQDPGPEGLSLSGYFDKGDVTRSSMDFTLSNDYGNTDGTIKVHGNFGKHDLSDGWYSEDQTNGIMAFQNFDLLYNSKVTVGIDIKRYGGTAKSNNEKLGTFFNDEYAAYVHFQKTFFKNLIAATGVRLEDNSNFGKEWIPKFGVVYHLRTQTALRASAAKGFRTPSIKDLFLFPPQNADLKPEELWNYEFGINQSIGKLLSVDICGYYYEGDQLIETAFNPSIKMMQNQNIGNNKARGYEISLKTNPVSNVIAHISYSYLDSDMIIPFSPNKFNFMVNYSKKLFTVSVYGENIQSLYSSYQPNGFPPQIITEKMANYTLVHAKFQYKLFEMINLSFGIENIFDESYEILKGYVMPGRTVFSGIQYSF